MTPEGETGTVRPWDENLVQVLPSYRFQRLMASKHVKAEPTAWEHPVIHQAVIAQPPTWVITQSSDDAARLRR